MDAMTTIIIYVVFIATPVTKAAIPGQFFWKPRMALDLYVKPTTKKPAKAIDEKDIFEGKLVMIQGYDLGLTVAVLAQIMETFEPFPHFNPVSAYFYTNTYRWALRHMSLIPDWLSGQGNHYIDTHKVWLKRFYYMDKFVPEWMRKILFFVRQDEWKKEEREYNKFVKHSESAFGKFYKYPSARTKDVFKSMQFAESQALMSQDSAV